MVGFVGTSFKRACCIPRSAATRDPPAGHCWPVSPQGTLRHSFSFVSIGWVCVLCPSQVWSPQVTRCFMSSLSQVSCASHSSPQFWLLSFPGAPQEYHLRYAACLLWRVYLRLQHYWWMSTIQDFRKTWLAAGACSQFDGRRCLWSWDCSSPLPSCFGCHKADFLPLAGEGPVWSLLALLWYSFSPLFWELVR